MRFMSGSRGEVLTKKKVPSGVWRCAVIVADNGDMYSVRFYRSPDAFKEGVDKVSAEAVRPCPPPLPVTDWAVDDVVEVLDGGYWRVSVIEEVIGDDCFQIHVIGSIDDFRVDKASIRMRQEWKDGKWISLGKESKNCEDMVTRMRKKARLQQQGDFINVQPITTKSVKRSFADVSNTDEVCSERSQKRRAVINEAKPDAISDDMYSFVGSPESDGILKQTQRTVNVLTSTISRRNLGKTSEAKECVSCSSSVASCSVIDPFCDRVLSHASTSCSQDDESLCSDAESSYRSGGEEGKCIDEHQGPVRAWMPYCCRGQKMMSVADHLFFALKTRASSMRAPRQSGDARLISFLTVFSAIVSGFGQECHWTNPNFKKILGSIYVGENGKTEEEA